MLFRCILTSLRRQRMTGALRRELSTSRQKCDHLDITRSHNNNLVGSENVFSRNVLLANPKYQTLAPLWKDLWSEDWLPQRTNASYEPPAAWTSLPLTDLLANFRALSESVHGTDRRLSDAEYEEMTRALSERVQDMTDDEIRFLLESLAFWGLDSSVKASNFYTLWKSLDAACVQRWNSWSVDKILLFADYWYNLYLARQSDFVYQSITKIAVKPKKLTPQQLVQLLFFLNVLRTLNKKIDMFEVEYHLMNCLHDLSLKEIGVAVTGFFKTQNVLHHPRLMTDIIDRLIKEKDTMEEITLTCILKILRLSSPISLAPKLKELMDHLEPFLEGKLSIQATCHVALLNSKFPMFHAGVLNKSSQFLIDNMGNARIKDMEKILFPVFLLSHEPATSENLFEAVGRELLKRQDSSELSKYPTCLITVLSYLSYRGVFVEPLIARVLTESFFRSVYGKTNFTIRRELFSLNCNVEIDCPQYSGPRLSLELKKYLAKRFYLYPPELDKPPKSFNRFFFDVLKTTNSLIPEKYVVKHLLPHSIRPDIVLRFDSKTGDLLPTPEEFRICDEFEPVRPPTSDRWMALVVASRNMFGLNGVPFLGEGSAKIRQLQSFGYETRIASYYDWPEDDTKKIEYLKSLIT